MRIDKTLASLVNACQKNFGTGYDQYAKGQQHAMEAFKHEHHQQSVLVYPGRFATGGRFDADVEASWKVMINKPVYLAFAAYDATVSSEDNILRESIRLRLGSIEYTTGLLVQARYWRSCFSALRVLCNKHDFTHPGFGVWSMGIVLDNLLLHCEELSDNPAALRDPHFQFFDLETFPWLRDHYASIRSALVPVLDKSRSVLLTSVEEERLYGEEWREHDALIDAYTVAMATGILESLRRNGSDWLTETGGKYQASEWSEAMKLKLKGVFSDNITLCESPFAVVDYIFRKGINFNIFTVSGIAEARHGRLFDNVPTFWRKSHTLACIAFVKRNMKHYLLQAAKKEHAQKEAEVERQRQRKLVWERRVLKSHLDTVSYFLNPTIRSITTVARLDNALIFCKHMYQKIDLLKLFILTYAVGYRMLDIDKAMSNNRNPNVGKYDDLYTRAVNILRIKKLVIPSEPPLQYNITNLTPEDYGLTSSKELQSLVQNYSSAAISLGAKIIALDKEFGCKLLFPYNAIPTANWDKELTPLQRRFPVGARFTDIEDDGKRVQYVSAGLYYDVGEVNDYSLFYYRADVKAPTTSYDDRTEMSHFKTSPGLIGIEDWKIEYK